jgi:LysM repeat protein
MTHLFERTALILLAGTALTACGTPRYAVNPPLLPLPPEARLQAPPPQVAAAQPDPAPQAAPSIASVESRQLAPLAPAQAAPPRPALADAAEPPLLALAPPAEDAFARARSRGPAATYTVKRGDTLAEIADRLGSDIETIAKANGLKKPYRLQPGQVLKNPKAPGGTAARSAKPAAPAEAKTYTVRSGDTLYAIALRSGTTVEALREANGLGRGGSLMPGRKLKLPGGQAEESADAAEDDTAPAERPASRRQRAESPPGMDEQQPEGRSVTNREVTGRVVDISTPGKSYKVKRGDSLERVANRLDSDIAELARLNKLKKPYRLKPGQTIRGPGSSAKAYVVGRGDTVSEIARRFSVSEAELRGANGLRRGASVAPGR